MVFSNGVCGASGPKRVTCVWRSYQFLPSRWSIASPGVSSTRVPPQGAALQMWGRLKSSMFFDPGDRPLLLEGAPAIRQEPWPPIKDLYANTDVLEEPAISPVGPRHRIPSGQYPDRCRIGDRRELTKGLVRRNAGMDEHRRSMASAGGWYVRDLARTADFIHAGTRRVVGPKEAPIWPPAA